MLIPLIDEASLRKAEVAAYDPFAAPARLITGPTFLYGAQYSIGDEVFDGTNYHAVIANPSNINPCTTDITDPAWSTRTTIVEGESPALLQTTSGTCLFQNIGPISRTYGDTNDVLLRLGNGSFALLQVVFPDTKTLTIEAARLVLTATTFSMDTASNVILSPRIVFEPILGEAALTAQKSFVGTGLTFKFDKTGAGGFSLAEFESGSTTTGVSNVFGATYVADPDSLPGSVQSAQTNILASADVIANPNTAQLDSLNLSAAATLEAFAGSTRNGSAEITTSSSIASESLVIALVNPAYEPLDIENLTYPSEWPPAYLDLSTLVTISTPRLGEQTAIDITPFLRPDRSVYTLILFRAADEVRADGRLRQINRSVTLLNGDAASGGQPFVQPYRNLRQLTKSVGGPYLGYIVDTFATDTGIIAPIPWFEASEARRIASRLTEINFYATEPGTEVEVVYNTASQQFIVTQIDFRTINGVEQNGLRTELRRISPIRIGDTLLYPMASYDLPWLLTKPTYVPGQGLRLLNAGTTNLTAQSVVPLTEGQLNP